MRRNGKAKQVVLVGLLSAILLMVQVILSGLPNIELVTLLITVYTIHFRRQALFIIYVFVMMEGILYGFGLWWFCYLYIWTILYVVAWLLRSNDSPFFWAFVNGLYGLLYGAMSSLVYIVTAGVSGGIAYFVAGIPFDITHCIGNFVAALLLFKPLNSLMIKVKQYLL